MNSPNFGENFRDLIHSIAEGRFPNLLDPEAIERLTLYSTLLHDWSLKVDLVSPCSKQELVDRHLVDSLLALELILNNLKLENGPWLDVGSGAGLPGLVWASCVPEQEIVLLEPREKRAVFLIELKRKLSLPCLSITRSRIESYRPASNFQLISCRALGQRDLFLERVRELLHPSGCSVELLGSSAKSKSEQLGLEAQRKGLPHFKLLPYPGSDSRSLGVSSFPL